MFYDLTLLGVFSFCLLPLAIDGGFDWCNHDCYNVMMERWFTHTMCLIYIYPPGGAGECQKGRQGLTNEEKEYIVEYHNEFRQKVAYGFTTNSGIRQPAAANMFQVSWDDEVAMIAQRWADQCQLTDGRKKAHDDCRKTSDDVDLGQNHSWTAANWRGPIDRMKKLEDLMGMWADEADNFDPQKIERFQGERPGWNQVQWSHYTAMVWWSVTHIGCGLMHLQTEYYVDLRLVCNYKSRGNYIDKQVYLKGSPATKCPTGSHRSSEYEGLCKAEPGNFYSSDSRPGFAAPFKQRIPEVGNRLSAPTYPSFDSYRNRNQYPTKQTPYTRYDHLPFGNTFPGPKHISTSPTYGLTTPPEPLPPRERFATESYSPPAHTRPTTTTVIGVPDELTLAWLFTRQQQRPKSYLSTLQYPVERQSTTTTRPFNHQGGWEWQITDLQPTMGQTPSPPKHSWSSGQTQTGQPRHDADAYHAGRLDMPKTPISSTDYSSRLELVKRLQRAEALRREEENEKRIAQSLMGALSPSNQNEGGGPNSKIVQLRFL